MYASATIIKLIKHSTIKSGKMRELSIPSIAFFEAFISTSNNGKITGNDSTGINTLLLPAFDAMEEMKVNVAAKPIHPANIASKNKGRLITGCPKTMPYMEKQTIAITSISKLL